MSADTFEYAKDEDLDVKIMFSGALLDSKIIGTETGELIEE